MRLKRIAIAVAFSLATSCGVALPGQTNDEYAAQLIRQGESAAASGDWRAAAAAFVQAASSPTWKARAFYDLGIADYHLGAFPQAIIAERTAIQLDEKFVSAYIQLATVLTATKDYAGAESALKKALAIEPSSRVARANLDRLRSVYLVAQNKKNAAKVSIAAKSESKPTLAVQLKLATESSVVSTAKIAESDASSDPNLVAVKEPVTVTVPEVAKPIDAVIATVPAVAKPSETVPATPTSVEKPSEAVVVTRAAIEQPRTAAVVVPVSVEPAKLAASAVAEKAAVKPIESVVKQISKPATRVIAVTPVKQIQHVSTTTPKVSITAVPLYPEFKGLPRTELKKKSAELVSKSIQQLNAGEVDQAKYSLKRATNLDPANAFAHINLGVVLGTQGDFAGEAEEEKAALLLDGKNAFAHYDLAWAYQQLGRWSESIKHYQVALQYDSRMIDALAGQALAMSKAGDLQGAINLMVEARKTYVKSAWPCLALSSIYMSEDLIDDARSELQEALKREPEDIFVYKQMAKVCWQTKDWKHGAMFVEKTLGQTPYDMEAFLSLAAAQRNLKNDADALLSLRAAAAIAPQNAVAHADLSNVLEKLGQSSEADNEAKIALRLNPDLRIADTIRQRIIPQ